MRNAVSFYRPEASTQFYIDDYWSADRQRLSDLGCKFLSIEQANQTRFFAMFDILVEYNQKVGEVFSCLPLQDHDFAHTPIPFSYEEHDERFIDGTDLQTLVERQVNTRFGARKLAFLCNPTVCIALEFDSFSYEIIHAISTGRANDWILICDENADQGIFFCEDGGMAFYSRRSVLGQENFCGRSDAFWIDYFNANFVSGVPHATQAYFDFVNINYSTRIAGLTRFEARSPM